MVIFKENTCFSVVFYAVGIKWKESEGQTLKTDELDRSPKII